VEFFGMGSESLYQLGDLGSAVSSLSGVRGTAPIPDGFYQC